MTIQRIRFIVAVLAGDNWQVAQNLFRLGADTEIGVSFGEENGSVAVDDIGRGQDQSPALIAVHERKVHQNAAIVLLMEGRQGVGETELLADLATLVEEQRERDLVLPLCEVALADGLRRDCDEQRFALAHDGIEIAPRFELRDAVRTPAPTEEADDERAKG